MNCPGNLQPARRTPIYRRHTAPVAMAQSPIRVSMEKVRDHMAVPADLHDILQRIVDEICQGLTLQLVIREMGNHYCTGGSNFWMDQVNLVILD
jgi:hypothetical protein